MITAEEARKMYERSYAKQEIDGIAKFVLQELDKKIKAAAEAGNTELIIDSTDSQMGEAFFNGVYLGIDGSKKTVNAEDVQKEVKYELLKNGYSYNFGKSFDEFIIRW